MYSVIPVALLHGKPVPARMLVGLANGFIRVGKKGIYFLVKPSCPFRAPRRMKIKNFWIPCESGANCCTFLSEGIQSYFHIKDMVIG